MWTQLLYMPSINPQTTFQTNCVLALVMALVIAGYAISAVERNSLWKNEYIINTDTIRKSPGNARPYLNLGLFYFNKGAFDDALGWYETSLNLAPGYVFARNNLGVVYYKKGLLDMAIAQYKEAIRLAPAYAEAHYNLGVAYGDKGLSEEAFVEIGRAMELSRNLRTEMKYKK